MRFAYADPPYLGCCAKYGHRHEAPYGCWDEIETHRQLLRRLRNEYPDGWSLSMGSNNLEDMLHLCREEIGRNIVRIGPWVKPFAVFKPNVNPAYAWEPVIFMGGRKRSRADLTVRDWHAENITLQKGTPGAKPPLFPMWISDLLGINWTMDDIDDLFPGSHGMTLIWNERRMPSQEVFNV